MDPVAKQALDIKGLGHGVGDPKSKLPVSDLLLNRMNNQSRQV